MEMKWLAGLSVLALGACSSDGTTGLTRLQGVLGAARDAVLPGEAAPAGNPETIAATALSSVRGPLLLASVEHPPAVAALVPYGNNAGRQTWSTLSRQSITLDPAGRVIATRGLGADLMALEAAGGARPVYHFLDAANRAYTVTPTCSLAVTGRETIRLSGGEQVAATKVEQACDGDGAAFRNIYWVQNNGSGEIVRRSRQWLGPITGYAVIDRLR